MNGDEMKERNVKSVKDGKRTKTTIKPQQKARRSVEQIKLVSQENNGNFEDKLIDLKKWLRRVINPGPYKPSMPHLPYFASSDTREKARLNYLEDLEKWEALWNKERENRVKELNALQSLYTASEWQELMYDLTRSVQQILRDQEDRRRGEKQEKEKEAKLISLITSIVEKYPWPAEPQRKSKLGKEKRANKNKHDHTNEIAGRILGNDEEEVSSSVECPECGKVFMRLDENGCCIQDFGRCEDSIGEGDDDDLCFEKDFNVLSDILRIYLRYSYDNDTYNYINLLAGVNLFAGEDWSCFLEALGISVITNMWDGGGPCHSGYYSFLTVRRESQDFLLKKLTVIQNRLKALEEQDKSGGLDGLAKDE